MLKDERGYGVVELMVIISALGAIAFGIFTTLEGGADTGLTGAANDVSTNINDQIKDWNPTN